MAMNGCSGMAQQGVKAQATVARTAALCGRGMRRALALLGIVVVGNSAAQAEESRFANPFYRAESDSLRLIGLGPISNLDSVVSELLQAEQQYDAVFPVLVVDPVRLYWRKVKADLYDRYGLALGMNYTALFQAASDGLPGKDRQGASGDFDFYGRWEVVNRGGSWTGSIVFSTEFRHGYGSTTPADLGTNIGSLWRTTGGFNDEAFTLNEIFWKQGSFEDRVLYGVGKFDPGLFIDGGSYTSSNYNFLSPAIGGSLTMPIPSTGLGAGLAWFPYKNTYVSASLTDANGSKEGWGDLGAGELFSAIELGLVPGFGTPEEGRYHVNFWHLNGADDGNDGASSGWGFSLYAEQHFGQYVPFVRYAEGTGAGLPVRRTAAAGLGFERPFGQNNDLIGFGLGWGEPVNQDKSDQYVFEAFYRVQLTPATQLTPDLQIIFNPVDNPEENAIAVGGIRLRTLF